MYNYTIIHLYNSTTIQKRCGSSDSFDSSHKIQLTSVFISECHLESLQHSYSFQRFSKRFKNPFCLFYILLLINKTCPTLIQDISFFLSSHSLARARGEKEHKSPLSRFAFRFTRQRLISRSIGFHLITTENYSYRRYLNSIPPPFILVISPPLSFQSV